MDLISVDMVERAVLRQLAVVQKQRSEVLASA
jgi:hypothetical protein